MRWNVGLVGFGTVGQAVARALEAGDRRRAGLRLHRVCVRPGGRERPRWLSASVGWTDRFDRLLAPDIDILVELVGGLSPARRWVERALRAGKPVVTANKQLIAEHGPELRSLAARAGCPLRFEGAVAGGIPIIRAVQDGLAGDRLVRIGGVLNGTCNYVLTRMETEGLPFADALAEAQALGFAERDPTADIDGIDARAKLAILCEVGLGIRVNPRDIPCASIAGVSAGEVAAARRSGHSIRQVAWAERIEGDPGRVASSVGPVLVAADHPFARAAGCENVIVVTGELGGETVYSGRGAGGDATAVAVVSDLLAVASAGEARLAGAPLLATRSSSTSPAPLTRPFRVRAAEAAPLRAGTSSPRGVRHHA